MWVNARIGIIYNEQVDKLAKERIYTEEIVEGFMSLRLCKQ